MTGQSVVLPAEKGPELLSRQRKRDRGGSIVGAY